MAISTQIQNLNLIPGKSAPVVVHLSQGNVGNTVQFYLYDGDNPYYPTNVSIAVHGVRADNTVFGPYAVSTTSGSNLVSFDIVTAMTSVTGAAIGELVLTDSNQNQVGSANFGMLVEETPYSSSVTYEDDLSIYQRILAYVQSVPAELSGQIASEATARSEADRSIQNSINSLGLRIDSEASTRATEDMSLGSRIDSEASTRADADANLQTQINQIVAPSGEAPSAAEVQNARITYNDLTYSSLGEATRGQALGLSNRLKALGTGASQTYSTGLPGYWENGTFRSATSYTCSRIELDNNANNVTFTAASNVAIPYVYVHRNGAYTASGTTAGTYTIDLTGADHVLLNHWNSSIVGAYTINYNSLVSGIYDKLALGYGTHSAPWADYYGKTVTFPFSMCDLLPGYVTESAPGGYQPQTGYKHLLFESRSIKSISLSGGSESPAVSYGFLYKSLTDTSGQPILGQEVSPSIVLGAPTDGYIGINAFGGNYCNTMTVTFWDAESALGFAPKSYQHSVRKPISFSGKKCSFIGDSITAGFTSGNTQTTETYPKLFCEAVGAICDNEAIGGASIKAVDGYPVVINQLAHVVNPDIIFVAAGVNDWQLGVSASDFQIAVHELALKFNSDYPNIPIIWITPINKANWTAVGNTVLPLSAYRRLMTPIIIQDDTQHRFSIVQGGLFNFPDENDRADFISYAFGDGLHPSEAAYANIYVPSLLNTLL